MQLALNVIIMLLSGYALLLVIRILISWFQGVIHPSGRLYDLLYKATDPYLRIFRRFKFLRFGFLDLSTITGIMFIYLIIEILRFVQAYNTISLGIILAITVSALWSIIRFLAIIFLVMVGIRYFFHISGRGAGSPLMGGIDNFIYPLQQKIERKIFKGRIISFSTGLLVTAGLLAALIFLGGYGIGFVINLLARLPI